MKTLVIIREAGFMLCAILVIAGCSQAPKKPSSNIDRKNVPYDFEKEGNIPPLPDKDIKRVPDVEEIAVTSDTIEVEEIKPAIDSSLVIEESRQAEPSKISGFRIQIFASLSSISSEEVKEDFESRFSIPAYVTYVGGMYKVRVGDFANRKEAEESLTELRSAGFKDAWIVEAYIERANKKR